MTSTEREFMNLLIFELRIVRLPQRMFPLYERASKSSWIITFSTNFSKPPWIIPLPLAPYVFPSVYVKIALTFEKIPRTSQLLRPLPVEMNRAQKSKSTLYVKLWYSDRDILFSLSALGNLCM